MAIDPNEPIDSFLNSQLLLSRRKDRRKRVENIQVLVAIGIIGIYFTAPAQTFLSENNLAATMGYFLFGIGTYLILKLFSITIRSVYEHRVLKLFGEILLPFGFITTVFGYILWVVSQFVTISLEITVDVQRSAGIILVVLSPLAVWFAYKNYINYQEVELLEEKVEERIKGQEFEEILYSNPDMIEEGLELEGWNVVLEESPEFSTRGNQGSLRMIDFIGTDKDGNRVILEAKTRVDRYNAGAIINQLAPYTDDNRVVVASLSSTEGARDQLREHGIECLSVQAEFDKVKGNFVYHSQ